MDLRGGGPNLYSYVLNDPIGGIDPLGLKVVDCRKGECPDKPPIGIPFWKPDNTAPWSIFASRVYWTHRGQDCYQSGLLELPGGGNYLHCCYDATGHPIYAPYGSACEDYNPYTDWWAHAREAFWYSPGVTVGR